MEKPPQAVATWAHVTLFLCPLSPGPVVCHLHLRLRSPCWDVSAVQVTAPECCLFTSVLSMGLDEMGPATGPISICSQHFTEWWKWALMSFPEELVKTKQTKTKTKPKYMWTFPNLDLIKLPFSVYPRHKGSCVKPWFDLDLLCSCQSYVPPSNATEYSSMPGITPPHRIGIQNLWNFSVGSNSNVRREKPTPKWIKEKSGLGGIYCPQTTD